VTIQVRTEEPGDREAVRGLNEAAFPTTTEADLVDALRADGDTVPELCLVAVDQGEVVGHICFSRAGLDPDGPEILALAPMAVLPDRQSQGIGGELIREALSRAERTDHPLVIVLGHADYYPRFGFDPASAYGIRAPFEVPDENWMAYTLPSYEPGTRGRVVYAKAFAMG
jgi:predicted N-acetyltransferase YhbS